MRKSGATVIAAYKGATAKQSDRVVGWVAPGTKWKRVNGSCACRCLTSRGESQHGLRDAEKNATEARDTLNGRGYNVAEGSDMMRIQSDCHHGLRVCLLTGRHNHVGRAVRLTDAAR